MRSFWKNTKAAIVGTVFILNAIMIVMWVLVACQPKTVVVERVDGTLVPVEIPDSYPPIRVVDRQIEIDIDHGNYGVYKTIDIPERQICTVYVARGTLNLAISCRPMTDYELETWK